MRIQSHPISSPICCQRLHTCSFTNLPGGLILENSLLHFRYLDLLPFLDAIVFLCIFIHDNNIETMVLAQLAGLVICIPANFLASYLGCYCRIAQDRDMLLPLSAILFTFYPLVISLPQAHFKLITYTLEQQTGEIDEDEIYPYAFLICLFSITACMFVDKFYLEKCRSEEEKEGEQRVIANSDGIKFFLSLSIVLQNFVNYYYVCMEENDDQLFKEIFLFGIFSLFINFAYAYLLSEAEIDRKTIFMFVIFINVGLLFGFMVSLFLPPDILLLALPCFCAGVQIYCSIFICVPAIFSNGENNTKDKFRYCSILITFLFVVIYYPLCYLLRI